MTALLLAGTGVRPTTVLSTPGGGVRADPAVTAMARPLAATALNSGLGRGGAFLDLATDDEVKII